MKHLIMVLALATWGAASAQTLNEMELFDQRQLNGSARFVGMGGAMSALGNDLSAVALNPAGAATFASSELSFGLSFNNSFGRAERPFYGNQVDYNNFEFGFENAGLNLKMNPQGKHRFALAITFNNLADFDRNFSYAGNQANPFTLGEYWALEVDGRSVDDGLIPAAAAAYDAYILDANGDGIITANDYAYGNELPDGSFQSSSLVDYELFQTGRLNETGITFAGDYDRKLYYGLSFNFTSLNLTQEYFITENIQEQDTAPKNLQRYTFREFNTIDANGFNLKFGLIYRPVPALRLAASYQSRTWYGINQFNELDLSAQFAGAPAPGVSSRQQSPIYESGEYRYNLGTPSIWRFGIAGIIAKRLSLNFDYHIQQQDQMNLYTNNLSFGISESQLNSAFEPALRDNFRAVRQTFAGGLEYRYQRFFLRGGYRLNESAYREDITDETAGDISTWSAGIGYRKDQIGFDLSFVSSSFYRNTIVYGDVLETIDHTITRNSFFASMTYRF